RLRCCGQRPGWPDLPDDIIDHIDAAIRPAPILIVHRNNQGRVLKQTGSHSAKFLLLLQHCLIQRSNLLKPRESRVICQASAGPKVVPGWVGIAHSAAYDRISADE